MAMQDIHRGFRGAVPDGDAEALFAFLDAAAALESVQACRQRMLELCPAAAGQRILDVGCGVGHSALQLAAAVGSGGQVVGVDQNAAFIAEARRRAAQRSLPLGYRVADACALDFDSRSFDVCRSERVLMYLERPERALDEMFRVTRAGGAIACFEFDYDGMVVDAAQPALTRRIAALVADSVPSPWIGRQLPRLMRERGARSVAVVAHMVFTPFAIVRRVVEGAVGPSVAAGQLPAQQLERWWRDLEQRAAAGQLLAGFQGFVVVARTP